MIHAVLIFNNTGKPRLTKFYSPSSPQHRASILSRIFNLVSPRDDTLCNFVELPPSFGFFENRDSSSTTTTKGKLATRDDADDHDPDFTSVDPFEPAYDNDADQDVRVIYRHYATLYFAFVVDQSESELGILDLIQVFVESLDRCFENVCELDLIFHFDEVHTLLNCIITGGLVLDTSLDSIQANFRLHQHAKKQSESSATGAIGSIVANGIGGLNRGSGLGSGASTGGEGIGGGGGGGGGGGTGAIEGAWERLSGLGGFGGRR
ncbi:hypothetical protein JCM10212_004676 [Sporobolomyces blumeae]